MYFRIKGLFVSVLAATIVLPLGALFVAAASWLDRKHLPSYFGFLAMLSWLAFGSLLFFTIVRLLKCPHCGKRFGWKNYASADWFHIWPSRDCPHCGADTYQSREDYANDLRRRS
jgi:endogenous inhibitor of DNA gyrase (YacG/DUF329 family)